jgi:sugar phosphate isomerase/epimerase
MNIGIRLHDTRPGTLRERLAYAVEQGFSCVQLAMGKAVPGFQMEEAPALLTEDLAAEVKEELELAGMECAVLGCYLKLAVKDEEEALRVRKIYRAHLRFAARIGARCTGTETPPAAGPEGSGCRTEEQYRLFLDRVRPVVREAEETGVTLAVEPVCSHIIHSAETAERMLENLKSDHVRIILDAVNLIDSAHTDRADELVLDAVRRLGDRVCVLHMKDFVPQPGADRPRPVPCGQGQMAYGPLLALAREKNLPMTLENTTPDNAEQTRSWLESQL